MRKQDICLRENKDAEQLYSNCTNDQRLLFRYTDNKIIILLKSKKFKLLALSMTVQPGFCQTLSKTPMTGFLASRLKSAQTFTRGHVSVVRTKGRIIYVPT